MFFSAIEGMIELKDLHRIAQLFLAGKFWNLMIRHYESVSNIAPFIFFFS